jgi:hypothetical protein
MVQIITTVIYGVILGNDYPIVLHRPITVAARSKARTVFARSKARIVGSNPTEGMDVCVCVSSVFVLFCV